MQHGLVDEEVIHPVQSLSLLHVFVDVVGVGVGGGGGGGGGGVTVVVWQVDEDWQVVPQQVLYQKLLEHPSGELLH